MDAAEVRSRLLLIMREIMVEDPCDLMVAFAASAAPSIAFDTVYPAIVFYGDESFDLHRVDADGGFSVTMNFGPTPSPRRLDVPASAIAAWGYAGARVTLPANVEPTAEQSEPVDERPAHGLRLIPGGD